MVLGKQDIHMLENETRALPHTSSKFNPKWIKDLIVRHETTRRKHEGNVSGHWKGCNFFLYKKVQVTK
jgi:hypothetical protein